MCSDLGFESLEETSVAWKGTEETLKPLIDSLHCPEPPAQPQTESGNGEGLISNEQFSVQKQAQDKASPQKAEDDNTWSMEFRWRS